MDSLITAAARALAAGDVLGALKRVALRNDPPALALRGIAMAQLGDLDRAKALLRRAAKAFGPREVVARARCAVAEAEIALVSRDLGAVGSALEAARATLEERGDLRNAAHARCLAIRHLLLVGRLDEAESMLSEVDPVHFSPALQAAHELTVAGVSIRRLRTTVARAALARAQEAARQAGVPALVAEVEGATRALGAPAARLITHGEDRLVGLEEVETILDSDALVIDACRHMIHSAPALVSLVRRPVLFTLARTLGEAWPADMPRGALIARAFRVKRGDESHRARLRVEMGRLRAALRDIAVVTATKDGFALVAHGAREVVILAPPVEEKHAPVLALLADGESWSSSALAQALHASPRTVLRALAPLAAAGTVQPIGHGRARRWMTPPVVGYPTALLLPGPLPGD